MLPPDDFPTESGDFDARQTVKTALSTGVHKGAIAADGPSALPESAHGFDAHTEVHDATSTLRKPEDRMDQPIRVGSESDRMPESEVGSNERTNERTYGTDPNGGLSGTGSRRAGAAAGSSDGQVAKAAALSPSAEHSIAEARALMHSRRANLCSHGVAFDHCADHRRDGQATS